MSKPKKITEIISIRKAIGMFISAVVGFLGISAASLYWTFLPVMDQSGESIWAEVSNPHALKRVVVYFPNSTLDEGVDSCVTVYPVLRSVAKNQSVARLTLTALLSGPSWNEANIGYYTSINSGVKINSVLIKDGVAHVDFDKQIEKELGGSCRVSSIRAQITSTLKQFRNVKSVVISVDGNVDGALQP
jgi:spore germination protein GerM